MSYTNQGTPAIMNEQAQYNAIMAAIRAGDEFLCEMYKRDFPGLYDAALESLYCRHFDC